MAKSKKYDYSVEQENSTWTTKVTRRVTSKKVVVTKQKDNFSSEEQAREWGDKTLSELTVNQGISNLRHSEHRKSNQEERLSRSARRAEKTKKSKLEKLQRQQNAKAMTDPENTLNTNYHAKSDIEIVSDLTSEYNFKPLKD